MSVVCQWMIHASGGYSNCQDLKVTKWARSPSSKGMLSMLPRPGDSGDLGGVPRSDTSAAHRTLTLQCQANVVCYHPISQLQYSVKAFQAFRQIRVWKTLMIMLPFDLQFTAKETTWCFVWHVGTGDSRIHHACKYHISSKLVTRRSNPNGLKFAFPERPVF